MTTYDVERNRTTVWIQLLPPQRLTRNLRLLGYQRGDWLPLFWFHGRASYQDSAPASRQDS